MASSFKPPVWIAALVSLVVSCVGPSVEAPTEPEVYTKVWDLTPNHFVRVLGRTGEAFQPADMDFMGVVISTTEAGEDEWRPYASGLFTQVPDSLPIVFLAGFDYHLFAGFIQYGLDSLTEQSFNEFAQTPTIWQDSLLYGPNAYPGGFESFFLDAVTVHRSVPKANTVHTKHPAFTFLYGEEQVFEGLKHLPIDLQFVQYNSRYEVAVQNANGASYVELTLNDVGPIAISSDTVFSLDLKYRPGIYAFQNRIPITVVHRYQQEGTWYLDTLYAESRMQQRLHTTQLSITTPNPGATNTGDYGVKVLRMLNPTNF
ncbi:MAG TPA: hypothetical protein DCE41_09165 [Cytophagales bacterium]|nr:hypothetical protein [Cytophagales bacterium]HAA20354.1 hypothetical protein [Cytophagales bacterium]HAP62458.1 hypothetical protein [Cytophagales bacterium]